MKKILFELRETVNFHDLIIEPKTIIGVKYDKNCFGVVAINKDGFYCLHEILSGFREMETAPCLPITKKEYLQHLFECGFEDFILFDNIEECWQYIGKFKRGV